MIYLLAALLVVLIVKAELESRRRDRENDAWRGLIVTAQQAHRREVADLLQRIQAPEVAVAEHSVNGAAHMPQPVPLDDDEAFARAKAEEEDIAEALERMRKLEAEQAEFDARLA